MHSGSRRLGRSLEVEDRRSPERGVGKDDWLVEKQLGWKGGWSLEFVAALAPVLGPLGPTLLPQHQLHMAWIALASVTAPLGLGPLLPQLWDHLTRSALSSKQSMLHVHGGWIVLSLVSTPLGLGRSSPWLKSVFHVCLL